MRQLLLTLQGLGYKTAPVLSSVIELAGKIAFTAWIIPSAGYLGVCWTEPVIWVAMALFLAWSYWRLPLLKENGLNPRIL